MRVHKPTAYGSALTFHVIVLRTMAAGAGSAGCLRPRPTTFTKTI